MQKNFKDTGISVLLVIFCLISCSFPSDVFARPQLILGTFAGPPLSTNDETGFYDLLLKEAFRRAGVSIRIVRLPAERSITSANQGIIDGDFVRVAGLDSLYPNLLRVPEKITDFEFVAFSRDISIPITGWKSLQPYNVAIVRGWKILEQNIVNTHSLVKTKNQRLLFTLLQNDRTDIVVYSRFGGYKMIDQLGIKDARVLEPPLAVREMFLYLNKKHRALVPVLEKHLKAMKRDGSFADIKMKILTPLSAIYRQQ